MSVEDHDNDEKGEPGPDRQVEKMRRSSWEAPEVGLNSSRAEPSFSRIELTQTDH